MRTAAVETIVVEATLYEKKVIAAKARKLGLQISELMCMGAMSYHTGGSRKQTEAHQQLPAPGTPCMPSTSIRALKGVVETPALPVSLEEMERAIAGQGGDSQ